jgi:hypothetical protein
MLVCSVKKPSSQESLSSRANVSRNAETILILDELIGVIESEKNRDQFEKDFCNECLWFKQEISEGRMMVPLDSIQGYKLSYIIAEDYFHYETQLQKLSERLYTSLVEST